MEQSDYRVFEYSRRDKQNEQAIFSTEIVIKGYDILCFGDTTLPASVASDVAEAFFEEAEKAVLKYIDNEQSIVGG